MLIVILKPTVLLNESAFCYDWFYFCATFTLQYTTAKIYVAGWTVKSFCYMNIVRVAVP